MPNSRPPRTLFFGAILFAGCLVILVGSSFRPGLRGAHPVPSFDPSHGSSSPRLAIPQENLRKRPWLPDFIASFRGHQHGDGIRFELVERTFADGVIDQVRQISGEPVFVSGTLTRPSRGRFFFQKQSTAGVAGAFVGVVEFHGSDLAYHIEPSGPAGAPELVERPLDQVKCDHLPPPNGVVTNGSENSPLVEPGNYPDLPIPPYQNGIAVLESLPGAPAVIYLDFQGGYTPTWGGVTYTRPIVNNDEIRDVWRRVVEDFMPFSINVTTDLGVFEAAPQGSRQRAIITPTTIAAPGEGGAAYTGSFNWTGETPCWVFEVSGKACAEACSHELGHTLGLSHDGQLYGGVLYEYFSGQGTGDTSWAPIMGLPYYAAITQWSIGDYSNPDNPQDQLALIVSQNNSISCRADDTGDTLATSRYLDLYPDSTASAEGIIERTGDVDAFQFSTSGGDLTLTAQPVSVSPNLAIQAALYDAQDRFLTNSDPQTNLSATLALNLPAGTYTFRVSGAGRNDPLTDGFSSYGSLGYYSITGQVANARLPQRFVLPEYSTNGTLIGKITNSFSAITPVRYLFVSGNTNNTFALDSDGMLYVANQSVLDSYAFLNGARFPIRFELLVDLIDDAQPSLSETNRRVLVDLTYVARPPVLEQQPANLSLPAGTNATFAVGVSGDLPLFYQWFFQNVALPGANGPTLALTNVQAAAAGQYFVAVTNGLGFVASSAAVLTVQPRIPIVLRPPQSQALFPGLNGSLGVVAEGTEPISYQWQLNGADLFGATNPTVTFPVTIATAGRFRVVLSNEVGVTSADANIVLTPVVAWGGNTYGQTNLPPDLTNVVSISAGANHSMALRRDGSVISWGGIDPLKNRPPALTNAVAIVGGFNHSLALTADGTVVAWGDNAAGQTNVPSDLGRIVSIAAGEAHSMALDQTGNVRVWGWNASGQATVPPGATNVIAIAAGARHSLALRADGTVLVWGDTSFGQNLLPTNLYNVLAIAAGGDHSLALLTNGTVLAWGDNQYGQSTVPPGLSNIVAVAAGSFHNLALSRSGVIVAWGAGLTNDETFPQSGQSVIPSVVNNITAISAGATHSMALAGDGAPFIINPPIGQITYSGPPVTFSARATGALPLSYQWQFDGTNIYGATNPVFTIPNAFTNNAGDYRVVVTNRFGVAVSLAANLRFRDNPPVIAAQPVGARYLVGSQVSLQASVYGSQPLFYQWRRNGVDLPGQTQATLTFARLSGADGGDYYVLVSNTLGTVASAKTHLDVVEVLAWGDNSYGQTNVPAGLNEVVSVAGGPYHALALKSDGTVAAWGAKALLRSEIDFGQCIVPADLTNAVAVAAGNYHSMALRSDGTVVAWGAGKSNAPSFYEAGQSAVPPGLKNVIAIAAGEISSAALTSDGSIVAWGRNQTLSNALAAVHGATAVSLRDLNFAALKSDGSGILNGLPSGSLADSNTVSLACGGNFSLLLNNSGKVTSLGGVSPPRGLSNVVQIAAGGYHGLAVDALARVWTWGGSYPALTRVPTGLVYTVDIAAGENFNLLVVGTGMPLIKNQPVDQTVIFGHQAMLSAVASGVPPLSYQWRLGDSDLPGATNATLWLVNAKMSDAGAYTLAVSNLYGSVTSRVAQVSVQYQLSQALNNPLLFLTPHGDVFWFAETNVAHDGSMAAQSGRIGDNQSSSLSSFTFGPGILSFWWKVSSENYFDLLSFSVDGVQQTAISGEVDWQWQTAFLGQGGHVLTWTYAKDLSGSSGLDAGWIDEVSYLPAAPVVSEGPLSQDVLPGSVVLLSGQAVGQSPLSYQWVKDGVPVPGATSNSFRFIAGGRLDSGAYYLAVSNSFGIADSSPAIVRVRVPQKLTGVAVSIGGAFQLFSEDVDGGSMLGAGLTNFILQTSTDLRTWQVLTNAPSLVNGMLFFAGLNGTNPPVRFYRVAEH
jgi:alpha-tubulin suppressor-like RCC1 family protein